MSIPLQNRLRQQRRNREARRGELFPHISSIHSRIDDEVPYHSSNNEPVIESKTLRYAKSCVYADEENQQRQWKEHRVDNDHGIAASFWIDIVWRGPRSDDFWWWESHYLVYCMRLRSQSPRLHSFCIWNRQDTTRHGRRTNEEEGARTVVESMYVRRKKEQARSLSKPLLLKLARERFPALDCAARKHFSAWCVFVRGSLPGYLTQQVFRSER
jgi:hypothetical protein